jgi:hypothetical protein
MGKICGFDENGGFCGLPPPWPGKKSAFAALPRTWRVEMTIVSGRHGSGWPGKLLLAPRHGRGGPK